MPQLLEKVANVLDNLADMLDQQEQHVRQEQRGERLKVASQIRETYSQVTGEELPEETVEKIASHDENVLKMVQKLANSMSTRNYDGGVDTMGEPSNMDMDMDTDAVYATKTAARKASVEQASDAFLSFIME